MIEIKVIFLEWTGYVEYALKLSHTVPVQEKEKILEVNYCTSKCRSVEAFFLGLGFL